MGYKGLIRSVSAASNKMARESARRQRVADKERERLQKKISAIDEKKAKVLEALQTKFASGKISKEQYDALESRVEEVGIELIAFGKAAGVAAAKRYVCGDIEKEEFLQISQELLPAGFLMEKEKVATDIDQKRNTIREYHATVHEAKLGVCQKCDKEKGFFRPITLFDSLQLCGGCITQLKSIKTYPGFVGTYVIAPKFTVDTSDAKVEAVLKNEYL